MSYSEVIIHNDIEIKTKDNITIYYINAWCDGFCGFISIEKPRRLQKDDIEGYLRELDKICCKNKRRKHKIKNKLI